jgi:hypothetical protein
VRSTLFLYVLVLIFLMDLAAQAQAFRGLVTVGINTSQIDGDRLSGYYKSGLLLGGGVALQLHQRWLNLWRRAVEQPLKIQSITSSGKCNTLIYRLL